MDVQGLPLRASRKTARSSSSHRITTTGLSRGSVGEALGDWQRGELRLARSFAECKGLAHEQLEDIYQDTALALLERSFHSEEHLRNALRWGLKRRALHLHRDDRRRGEILAQRTPELRIAAEGREQQHAPELAAILVQDRLIVAEFMSELSELEQRVFRMEAEGLGYRAMAPILRVQVNEARKAFRDCERKRARFQLLHDTGRLCGYRSHTIDALLGGEGVSERLARGAWAHVARCAHCRADHRTNARRLRHSFQEQAAALLPIPAFAGHMGWLTRLDQRLRTVQERVFGYGSPPGAGALREGALATLASGGAAVKIAAAGATVVALAGSTIGATHALERKGAHHRLPGTHKVVAHSSDQPVLSAPPTLRARATSTTSARPSAAAASGHGHGSRGVTREPGGFAFLGVASGSSSRATQRASARIATVHQSEHTTPYAAAHASRQSVGGPFSP
jgi:RNA polymerase sigma factor (sigma-70 family)